MAQLRAPPPYTAEPLPSQHPSTRQSSARQPHRSRNSSSSINTAAAEQSIYRIAPTPSPKKVRRSDLVIPIRRHQQGELVSGHLLHNNPLRPSSKLQRSYDGAHDYQQESRITSTTWSTVSRISNRIFSDSSSSSREFASAKYSCDYNEIATKLGLPELSQPSNGEPHPQGLPPSKPEVKRPKHGWFYRKLLPRHSTTFTYKSRTTYRPIARRKSFSRPLSSSENRKNILEGKSLEETCRLGGLGVLPLPVEYAVDKPTLPTSLSATGAYILHHGVNAPGLFRISGQSSVVNDLYDYYAYQFEAAGTPTKVQATVQPGVLPLHIPYTLSDVTTLLKKIVKGFPGGLLGSIETFDAIKNVFLKLEPDPALAAEEMNGLRAKLIALTILSISSSHRFNLIQAIFGLFACIGDEAETARRNLDTEQVTTTNSSELMGYHAFGVCLGPLLLGNLIEELEETSNIVDHHATTDDDASSTPTKKHNSLPQDKLRTPAQFNSAVDCANLTADITQRLLMIWRDVVKQLGALTDKKGITSKKTVPSHSRKASRQSSRHSVKVTDDELLFLDMMRGGRATHGEYPYNLVVKKEIKAKSRSSLPRIAPTSSDNPASGREWYHEPVADKEKEEQQRSLGSQERNQQTRLVQQQASDHPLQDTVEEPQDQHHITSTEDDPMVHGQILPAREIEQPMDAQNEISGGSPTTSYGTPTAQGKLHRPSKSTPDASLLTKSASDDVLRRSAHRRARTNDKPILSMKKGLPPPPVQPATQREHQFPPRQSSLEKHVPLPLGVHAVTGIETSKSDTVPIPMDAYEVFGPDSGDQHSESAVHRFSSSTPVSGHGAVTKDSAPKFKLPMIPPFVKATAQSPHLDDPFTERSALTTPKSRLSLIPKPISEVGRSRHTTNSSPSPSKRKSLFNIVNKDGSARLPKQESEGVNADTNRSSFSTAKTRPLSAFTLDSLRQLELDFQQSDVARQIYRPETREVSKPRMPSYSFLDSLNTSYTPDTLFSARTRKATNSTLFAEIGRLKRQLEHKEEIIMATQRSLDAATVAREDGPFYSESDEPRFGSWSKGTLSLEVRDMKKQRDAWKQRAEWAEKRLVGIEKAGRGEYGWMSMDGGESWVED